MWASTDGKSWRMLSNSTWGCGEDGCGKFDFWPLVVKGSERNTLLTLGGSNAYTTFGKMWADTWALQLPKVLDEKREEVGVAGEKDKENEVESVVEIVG